MEGHAKKRVERYRELANTTTNNSTKYQLHAFDDHQFERRRMEIRGRIVKSMLNKLFWNACTRHVLEDLIFYSQ